MINKVIGDDSITNSLGIPPPRVVAKAWTGRAAVYWLHPNNTGEDGIMKHINGYKVKRYRLDKGGWTLKVIVK